MLATLLAVSLTLAMGQPAGAAPPKQRRRVDDFVTRIHCGEGLTLRDYVHDESHITRYFDRNGNRLRIVVHNRWTGTIVNPDTGATIASDPGHWRDSFVGPIVTTTGQLFNIKIAALGISIRDVGRTIVNMKTGEILFQSSSPNHHEGYEELCAALA
jgi:hypothetical protein